jgi:hypothetical protein
MLKKVNLNDFSDIKFSPKKPSFQVNKDDVYNILYNFLIKKKSLSDEDISYCSRLDKNNVQEDNSSNADHCKIEFYIYKMVSTKDKNVCKIFDTKFTDSYIMDSKIKNSELCNTIYDLASKNNITDEEIKSKVKYIQGTDNLDQDTFLIFKTIANNKDFCSDVSVLGTKLECYSYLYKDTFFDKFNEIYKQITKTKYLYIF